MNAEIPIDFLISINQGLQEEQRLIKQIKTESQRIDEELDYKYHKLLDSMIKMSILTKSVKTVKAGELDAKFLIKKSDDLSITNISLIEGILQMMKRDPSYLLDFLETSEPASLFNFMNELPSFYFDYTEIKDYANFLELFFSRKYEKGGFVDYKKNIDFRNLYNCLIWESDCLSFAQGVIEELVSDIKKLQVVEKDVETDSQTLKSKSVVLSKGSGSDAKETVPMKPTSGSTKNVSINTMKITTGNETSEIMRSYRLSIENYIKVYMNHQSWSRNIKSAEALGENMKMVFQKMVSDYTCPQEKVNEPTRSHFLDQNDFEFDRTIWPYSRADLHKLLEKWSKKISVDLASHIPPKMACMIGTFWNVFSQNEEYLWNTQKFLNELLFKVWLKNIIPIVNLNAGYVYQLTVEEREYVGNFLGILQQRLTGTETKPEQEEKQYQGYMLQCYQSLGRYVKNLKRPEDPEFTINVSYYFQGISISNLIELINYYLSLDDEVILKKQADSPGFKTRKKEIQVIANKLQDFMNDDNYKANYKKNIYIVFSKKNAMKALEKIVKNDIEFSEKYFQNTPNNGENVIKTLEFFYSKRREIMGEFDKLDLKIIGLLRDYLRSIDLNYIEATKSYFKEQFTLIDLLRRDKINKRFTKVSHIKMDVDGGISFSVEMAADYLVQKMEEWKEDVTLTGDCIRNSDPMNLYQSNFSNSVDEFGVEALPNLEKKNAVYNMNLFELDSKKYKFIKYIRFLSCENRIRVKYFQHLATNLARSKSLFENRFILPFDITMRFGLEALEKMVAFQFVEKHLLEVTNLNLKIEMSEDEITVLADEEIVDNPPQNIQSILTLSGFGRKKEARRNSFTLAPTQVKSLSINTFEEAYTYLKSSRELGDFTTMGIDRRSFKAALHKILKQLKKSILTSYEKSGLANSSCLTDKFTALVEQSVFNYVSSKIFLEIMSKKPTMKDFCFYLRCKSLGFLQLNDFIQKDDTDGSVEYMSMYLEDVIRKIKSIDEGGSVYLVIRCIEQAIIGIADLFHIVLGFKTPPGSEDILPIFLYCLVKANLQKAQSIFYFLELMMINEERRGKDGFNFTQVETGINFVENLRFDTLAMEETAFELKLMAGEVTVGIHRYRKRNPATRTSVKYDIQDEHGFF